MQHSQVTASDYCNFLNQVAGSNAYFFYNEKMGSDPLESSIYCKQDASGYQYFVIAGRENSPINFLSSYDKQAYCSWCGSSYYQEASLREDPFFASNESTFLLDSSYEGWSLSLLKPSTNSRSDSSSLSEDAVKYVFFLGGGIFLGKNIIAADQLRSGVLTRQSNEDQQCNSSCRLEYREQEKTAFQIRSGAIFEFIQNYNRAETIANKKEVYQRELAQLLKEQQSSQRSSMNRADENQCLSSSIRIETLRDLIAVLNKGISYQNAIVRKLYQAEASAGLGARACQESFTLRNVMMVNERPNKIEIVAKKIEEDRKLLFEDQTRLIVALGKIEQHRAEPYFRNALEQFQQAILARQKLIKQRREYAVSRQLPFEQIDETKKVGMKELERSCARQEARAQYKSFLGQVLIKRGNREEGGNREIEELLQATSDAYEKIILNVGDFQFSEMITKYFEKSAKLYQQALMLYNEGRVTKALYQKGVGDAMYAIGEARERKIRIQQAIDWYEHAAGFYELAIIRWDNNQLKKAGYLNQIGGFFYKAAMEAMKGSDRNDQSINSYLNQAFLLEEKVQDCSKLTRIKRWMSKKIIRILQKRTIRINTTRF